MGSGALERRSGKLNLKSIQGDPNALGHSRLREVDLPNDFLGIEKNASHPLPEPLAVDGSEFTKPERHERLLFQGAQILRIRLDLTHPFTTSFGTIPQKDIVLVRLKDQDGTEGVGECPVNPSPDYSEESTETVITVLGKHLMPALEATGEITNVEDLINGLNVVQGNNAAKCGIEAAYWDLLSRRTDLPLFKFWKGTRTHALTGVSVGGKTIEEVLGRVDKVFEQGFPRVKVKIWPGMDIELIDAIRTKYPDMPLWVDANASYDLTDIATLRELDKHGLTMIEQPFSADDLLGHARLQAQVATPICLDESLKTLANVMQAIELWKHIGRLDSLVVNVKPPRMGGHWEAVRAADLCSAAGVRAWCGGMLESAWGKRMNLQLSSHFAFDLPGDHAQQEPYYKEDIAEPPVVAEHGFIDIPKHSQNYELLNNATVARHTVDKLSYNFA